MERELQDLDAPYWTIDQAAAHLGFSRKTIVKYVRQGLPTYFAGTLVKPLEVVAEWKSRRDTQRGSQAR